MTTDKIETIPAEIEDISFAVKFPGEYKNALAGGSSCPQGGNGFTVVCEMISEKLSRAEFRLLELMPEKDKRETAA